MRSLLRNTGSVAITALAVSCSSGGTEPNQGGGPTVTGEGLTGFAVLGDNFTRYANTAALRANIARRIGGTGSGNAMYDDGLNANLAELDQSVTYNGHPTLKYNQPGGTAATPALWASLPTSRGIANAWIRIKVRFSPNFSTTGTTPNSANSYKLLGWAWFEADGRGTLEFTNTDEYTFNWNVTRNGSVVSTIAVQNGPEVSTEWRDGDWYQYIVNYQQTSSTSIRQRWWMSHDGATPQLQADITGQMRSGNALRISRVMLGLNFNESRQASHSQALWIGQWELVDGGQHPNPFDVPGG